jgi:predicted chitinase
VLLSAREALVAAMNKAGITDLVIRNGIMAIAAHEGGLGTLKPELGYSRTANSRIRSIFRDRVEHLTDAQLAHLKADDRRFFNFVYDGANRIGKQLGNRPGTDDGYNFRGRGPPQFTGRYNYERYARLADYPEVMTNLELVDDPMVGAAMTVAYIFDRYKGGGFDRLMKAVGSSPAKVAQRKRATFQQYMAAHQFERRVVWYRRRRPGSDRAFSQCGRAGSVT